MLGALLGKVRQVKGVCSVTNGKVGAHRSEMMCGSSVPLTKNALLM